MFNNLGTALEHLDRLDDARMAYDAGGKLGSKEAASSRKRLEGVDSIAVAKVEPKVEVKNEAKTYDLTDEGDITDEDRELEMSGSNNSDEVESDDTEDTESSDDSDSAAVEVEETEPDVDEHADLGNGDVELNDEPTE